MQPETSGQVFPGKPYAPQYVETPSGGGAGRVFGCLALGCGGLLLLIGGLCGVGYWGIFYSGYPLRWVEAGIESEGLVEIEGMKGNMSNGVEAEKIRFRESRNTEEWSELDGLELKYKTTGSWFGQRGFVIESVRIRGARLRVKHEAEIALPEDFDLTDLLDELSDATQGKVNVDFNSGNGGGSIEIRQVLLENIVLVDPDTDKELKIEQISFDGLNIERGELVKLGDVTVKSDMLTIESQPSEEFSSDRINRRFDLTLKKQASPLLESEITAQMDVGFNDQRSTSLLRGFGDSIRFSPTSKSEAGRLDFRNYTPADFFSTSKLGVMPSAVNLSLQRKTGRREKWNLLADPAPSLMLGKTQLTIDPEPLSAARGMSLRATGDLNGQSVEANVRLSGRIPLVDVTLRPAEGQALDELWSQVVFGKPFSELNKEQSAAIGRRIERAKQDAAAEEERVASEKAETETDAEDADEPSEDESDVGDTEESGDDSDEEMADDELSGESRAASEKEPAAAGSPGGG